MSLIANAEFIQEVGSENHEVFAVINTGGINYVSVIFEKFNSSGEPAAFTSNDKYKIFVCNSCWNSEPFDKFSYEEIVFPRDWIFLRSVSLGTDVRASNSFDPVNQGNFGSILHFTYAKFQIDPIPDHYCRLTIGSR